MLSVLYRDWPEFQQDFSAIFADGNESPIHSGLVRVSVWGFSTVVTFVAHDSVYKLQAGVDAAEVRKWFAQYEGLEVRGGVIQTSST